MSLATLTAAATARAETRGHRMSWLTPTSVPRFGKEANVRRLGRCTECGATLTVQTHPPYNHDNIEGGALAARCKVTA